MNILDHAVARPTGQMREGIPDRSPLLESSIRETGAMRVCGFAITNEYELRVKLGVTFFANKSDYPRALEEAKKVLLHRVHEGLLAEMDELQLALIGQDVRGALAICDKIRTEIGL